MEVLVAYVELQYKIHRLPQGQEAGFAIGPDGFWQILGRVYFTCLPGTFAVFPRERRHIRLHSPATGQDWTSSDVGIQAGGPSAEGGIRRTIHDGVGQLIVDGPGYANLSASGDLAEVGAESIPADRMEELELTLVIEGVDLPAPVVAEVRLAARSPRHPMTDRKLGAWGTHD